MTRDDILRMAREAQLGNPYGVGDSASVYVGKEDILRDLERFAALVAAEKEQQMIRDGWRQCAKGQRTTQYCGLLDAAVKAEREACAKVCEDYTDRYAGCEDEGHGYEIAAAVRARGET